MWIVFIHRKQKYIMEFEGNETIKDVKNIFCQVYGYPETITFSAADMSNSAKFSDKPLSEIQYFTSKDYVTVNVLDNESPTSEKVQHTGPVKLNKFISIGTQETDEKPISERSSSSSRRRSSSLNSEGRRTSVDKK